MTYNEFEHRLLPALAEAADQSPRGQCEARQVAETVLPGVKEHWVADAVRNYEQQGYLGPAIGRYMDGTIVLSISGNGRKAADKQRA
jgi:hypothetical protein